MSPETKQRILIVGAGFFGNFAKEFFGDRAMMPNWHVDSLTQIRPLFGNVKPTVVINAAGKTDTHGLENGQNRIQANVVNVGLPLLLAQLCQEYGAKLIHLSTGMMYDVPSASEARQETDPPDVPIISYYCREKLVAEQLLLESGLVDPTTTIVLRIHQPFAGVRHSKNLLTKLIGWSRFLDEPSSFTSLQSCLEAIDHLISRPDVHGIVHMANPGLLTHYQIAERLQQAGLIPADRELQRLDRNVLDAMTAGAGNAYQPRVILRNARLAKEGIQVVSVDAALEQAIRSYPGAAALA